LILDTFHLFNIIIIVVVVIIIAYVKGLASGLRCWTLGTFDWTSVGASDIRSRMLDGCAGMYSRLPSSDSRQLTTGEVLLESGVRVIAREVDGSVVALHVGTDRTGRDKSRLGGYRGLLLLLWSWGRVVVVVLAMVVLGYLDLAQSAVEAGVARSHAVVMADDMSLRLVRLVVAFGGRVTRRLRDM
jgi:hypothetical protein